jgi:hypothetical protein
MDAPSKHATMRAEFAASRLAVRREPAPVALRPRAPAWHGAAAAVAALLTAAAFWFAIQIVFILVDGDAAARIERHLWLDVAAAGAVACAFAAALASIAARAGGMPAWAVALAGAAIAAPVLGPGEWLLPGLGAATVLAAAVTALGFRFPAPRHPRRLGRGLALAAVLLALATAGALAGREPASATTSLPASRGEPGAAQSRPSARGGPAATPKRAAAAPRPARTRPRARRLTTPAATAPAATAPVLAPSAAQFMRAYYTELHAERFGAAWARLAPSVRARFGPFASWRAGFATTTGQRLSGVTATVSGETATVSLTLHATDDAAHGATVRRRFAQTWTLTRTPAGWRTTDVSSAELPP